VHLAGGGAHDEMLLGEELRRRGARNAVADYWVSYRLTFLWRETVAVVPIHAAEDRYAPYRDAFERAGRFAYVFDPARSKERFGSMLAELQAAAGSTGERVDVGALTAVVFDRGGMASGGSSPAIPRSPETYPPFAPLSRDFL